MSTVALKDITKVFPGGAIAVDKLNLEVADGEFLVLLGPSGCGKSTVLRIVAGLEDPTSGAVLINGAVANSHQPRERGVAMVFQDYALYPHMTVADNIEFPLRLSGMGPEARRERVHGVASVLGLGDVLGRRPYQLSGGQRQRVAMGRALVRQPGLFLMDEPLSNLDSGLRAELRAEISALTRKLGVSTIYVTHDQAEALTMADRVAILRDGVLQDVGTPTQVYNRPATLYVAAFLGSPRMNLIEATVHVHLDQYVALTIGEQVIYLPWEDMRTRMVAHYHGERIVIGMRPEALTPVTPDTPGARLVGTIRYLEHHGHETLAYLDVGATAVPLEAVSNVTVPTPVPDTTMQKVGRAVSRLARGATGRGDREEPAGTPDGPLGPPEAGPASPQPGQWEADPDGPPSRRERGSVLYDPGRHHRRVAEVALRLAPYPHIGPGQRLTVSIRLDALHFFDDRGDRIDIGFR